MEALIAALGAVVGSDAILTGSAIQERYKSPWTRLGAPQAVLRPASTQTVGYILRLASAAGMSVVPWGRRTGLVDHRPGRCATWSWARRLKASDRFGVSLAPGAEIGVENGGDGSHQ